MASWPGARTATHGRGIGQRRAAGGDDAGLPSVPGSGLASSPIRLAAATASRPTWPPRASGPATTGERTEGDRFEANCSRSIGDGQGGDHFERAHRRWREPRASGPAGGEFIGDDQDVHFEATGERDSLTIAGDVGSVDDLEATRAASMARNPRSSLLAVRAAKSAPNPPRPTSRPSAASSSATTGAGNLERTEGDGQGDVGTEAMTWRPARGDPSVMGRLTPAQIERRSSIPSGFDDSG